MVFGDANFTQSLLKLGREQNHHHETDQKLVTTHLTHLMSGGDIEDGPSPVLHHVAVGQQDVVVVQALLVSTYIALIHNGQICNVKPSIKYCTNNRGRIVRLLRFDEILKRTVIFSNERSRNIDEMTWERAHLMTRRYSSPVSPHSALFSESPVIGMR